MLSRLLQKLKTEPARADDVKAARDAMSTTATIINQ